jgi:transketolase
MVDAGLGAAARLVRIAAPDAFFKMSGEQEFARETLGLDAHSIARRVLAELQA